MRKLEEAERLKRQKEEAERQRLMEESHGKMVQFNDELLALKEAERLRLERLPKEPEVEPVYEHVICGHMDYHGVDQQNIQHCVDQLFHTAPIPFIPRPNEDLDKRIKEIIDHQDVTIPIIWIKNKMYLVGMNKTELNCPGNDVTARIGGGFTNLSEYLNENQESIKKKIVEKMIDKKESLEGVTDGIISETKKLSRGEKTTKVELIQVTQTADKSSDLNVQKVETGQIRKDVYDSPAANLKRMRTVGGAHATQSPSRGGAGSRSSSFTPNRFSTKQERVSASRASAFSGSKSPIRRGAMRSPTRGSGSKKDAQARAEYEAKVKHLEDNIELEK